jgi:hypothetical protein
MTNSYLFDLHDNTSPMTMGVDISPESDVMSTYRKKRSLRMHHSPRGYQSPKVFLHYQPETGQRRVRFQKPSHFNGSSVVTRNRSYQDDVMSFELPRRDYTIDIRNSLQKIHQRMDEHRNLINRYAAVDISASQSPSVVVDQKYQEMMQRMPQLSRPLREERHFDESIYEYPFTVRSDPAKNSRMRIQRILSRCRAL